MHGVIVRILFKAIVSLEFGALMSVVGRFLICALGGCLLVAPAVRAASAESAPGPHYWPAHPDDRASAAPSPSSSEARDTKDTRREVPIVAYAYSATGAPAKSVGAQGYGIGLAASGQDAVLGGGAAVWGAPVERLTLIGDASRNVWGNFSPSAAAVVRIAGNADRGFSFGALGKFKIDGFAAGPDHDEVESELELGALGSFVQAGWHLDLNAIAGRGLGDEGETDAEGRFRVGYDLGRYVRFGLDSQGRVRLAGRKYLPNGRTWDFAAGTQVMVVMNRFFGAFTAGPTTMGLVSDSVGASAILSFGGST